MKFKVDDQVIVTAGKDKGKKAKIVAVLPREDKVIVAGANIYARHIRKMQGKPGEIVRKERPLATAKIAILNDKGQPDRIGFVMENGEKVRIYKKTKQKIADQAKKK